MKLIKKTRVKRINIPVDKRLIFVSDIHGDVDTFKTGLEQIGFNSNDYLFIIGDMIEKGDLHKNLETLRFMYMLSKKDNVYLLSGNCDEVFRFINNEEDTSVSLKYLLNKKNSVFWDMAFELNYKIDSNMDVNDFVNTINLNYKELIDFCYSLDDVLFINDELVLVHGGINDIDMIPENALEVLKYDRFYELSNKQKKLMIVGHYPTRNYRADLSSCNPIFDFKMKIISIDGGNHVAKGGQINFVMLDSLNSMGFSYKYFDHYPKYRAKCDINYDMPANSFNITYGDNEVEILDCDLDFYYIRHIKSNICMWVHSSFVYENEITKKYYCYDGNNQFISLKKNDEISIIKKAMPYSLVKRNGVIGLIESRFLDNDI